MIIPSEFRAAPWLKNPHLQTIFANSIRRIPPLAWRPERLELPDGDFVDLAWTVGNSGPIVVVLHGLTGNIESSLYVRGLMAACHARGWRAVLMHFRGASGVPNRLHRFYHCGDTGDLDFLTQTLREREPNTPLACVGYSLGGNVLLKWLGESGLSDRIDAGVAVSVPFDLENGANKVTRGFSKVYQRRLIRNLSELAKQKFADRTPPIDIPDWNSIENFWHFDDAITAPLHGFDSAADYYATCSSGRYLNSIQTETLIVHAKDDPFMTPDAIPGEDDLSAHVTLELTQRGGHVGFVSADGRNRPQYWLEQRIPEWLEPRLTN